MITEKQYISSAKELGVKPAVIKAVAKVESGGEGIINGKPVILFEPHVFWKQLKAIGITPVVSDICYPVWGTKPYPSGQDAKWAMLDKAIKINRTAALKSASWGKFQIMGFNYKSAGCKTIQEFVNAMYLSEDEHLRLFVNYIKDVQLDDELQNLDWAGFARGYNGALYWKNSYDKKLKAAYNTFV